MRATLTLAVLIWCLPGISAKTTASLTGIFDGTKIQCPIFFRALCVRKPCGTKPIATAKQNSQVPRYDPRGPHPALEFASTPPPKTRVRNRSPTKTSPPSLAPHLNIETSLEQRYKGFKKDLRLMDAPFPTRFLKYKPKYDLLTNDKQQSQQQLHLVSGDYSKRASSDQVPPLIGNGNVRTSPRGDPPSVVISLRTSKFYMENHSCIRAHHSSITHLNISHGVRDSYEASEGTLGERTLRFSTQNFKV